ncbi:MAG TPA: hypothetical protein DIT07_10175 [Sphingobacteriaceae bacterium]|nr:hypothetical protein [Sphingobacteriaceae bacterium]
MKKLLIIIVLLVCGISFSKAQGIQGTPDERAEASLNRLPATLNLTADQKAKLKVIFVAQVKPIDSLIATMQAGGDRAAIMPKFMELQATTDKKIIPLLTPEQKTAYEAYVKERMARMSGR